MESPLPHGKMRVVVSGIVGQGGTLRLLTVSIRVIDSGGPVDDRAVRKPSRFEHA